MPSRPSMLATVTIEPRSPLTRGCAIILASAALATRKVPVRLIPITRSHSARSSRCTGPPPATPAAWKTPSRRSGTAAITAAIAASSPTSAVTKWKSGPLSSGVGRGGQIGPDDGAAFGQQAPGRRQSDSGCGAGHDEGARSGAVSVHHRWALSRVRLQHSHSANWSSMMPSHTCASRWPPSR